MYLATCTKTKRKIDNKNAKEKKKKEYCQAITLTIVCRELKLTLKF